MATRAGCLIRFYALRLHHDSLIFNFSSQVFNADLELLAVVDQIKRKRQARSTNETSKPPQPIRYEDAANSLV